MWLSIESVTKFTEGAYFLLVTHLKELLGQLIKGFFCGYPTALLKGAVNRIAPSSSLRCVLIV